MYPQTFRHPWANLYRDGRVANMRAFAGLISSSAPPVRAPYVGATSGDEWTQGGGGWEGGGGSQPSSPGGPTQLQISQLQSSVADLKNQVDGVVQYMDPDTDAASQAAVKALQNNVNALSSSVALLVAGTQTAFVNYPVLLIKYNTYKAEFDGYGLSVVDQPAPANPSQGKPAATPKTTTPVKQPASPDSPVIVTSPTGAAPNNTLPWLLLLGGGLLSLAAIFFARKAM